VIAAASVVSAAAAADDAWCMQLAVGAVDPRME
jgi:hypothetical protein